MIDADLDPRARIVDAAAGLLQQQGPSGVTTRAVATAAGVQAPTIYRLFGDKDGLMDAVAEHVISTFVDATAASTAGAGRDDADPVDALRLGWSLQIEFGLANPAVFALLSDPQRMTPSTPAGRRALAALERLVHRVAAVGRLRVAESRAVDLLRAAAIGTIQTLLAAPPERRDPALSGLMLDAVLGRVLGDGPAQTDGAAVAVAFRARVPALGGLTDAERVLLREWIDRAIAAESND